MRQKNAKKRCNLYVKNFSEGTSKEDLEKLFGQYGTIENIKVAKNENNQSLYAFVCFTTPDQAASAKQALNGRPFEGKQLYVNNYELKEYRKV